MSFLRIFPDPSMSAKVLASFRHRGPSREIDQNVAHQAAKLRARYGLKTPDALFLATALEEKAQAFITNDVRLKVIENIEIVLINAFVK